MKGGSSMAMEGGVAWPWKGSSMAMEGGVAWPWKGEHMAMEGGTMGIKGGCSSCTLSPTHLLRDLVHLVYVHNPLLRRADTEVGVLQQLEEN